jgi:cyclic peptide transporter
MNLLVLLAQGSRLRLIMAIFASVLGGVAELAATVCILESLRTGAVLWWQFAAIAFVSVVVARYSRLSLARLASKSILRMRRHLVRSVINVPLLDLERIGASRLLVAFTGDVISVAAAVRNLASFAASTAILVACLTYIGWYSWRVALVTAALSAVCLAGALVLRRVETSHRQSARQNWDNVVRIFGMLLDGVKQLKLNRSLARRVLLSFDNGLRDHQQEAGKRSRYSDLVATWMHAMFYVILGVAVFGQFDGDLQLKLGFAFLALLLLRRALRSIVSDSASFSDASVAYQRMTDIGLVLTEEPPGRDAAPRLEADAAASRSLELEGVEFSYPAAANDEEGFRLGPLDMALRPGEVLMVAGGSGSGKTTFVKLLTGLYRPVRGVIRVDGGEVGERGIRAYRNKFSAVFADACLFEGVADLQHDELGRDALKLAANLKLNRWMIGATGSPGASMVLSSGERARIALLKAVIEDRPVLVLDEWTADQDQRDKAFFYGSFLPMMRKSGKIVVVIANDEEYFEAADRVLKLERGAPPTWIASGAEDSEPAPAPGRRDPRADATAAPHGQV